MLDVHSFAPVFERHSPALLRYLSRFSPDSEDLLQELWIRYLARSRSRPFALETDEIKWLYRVARNLAVDAHRRENTVNRTREAYGINLRADLAWPPENENSPVDYEGMFRALAGELKPAGEYTRLVSLLLDGKRKPAAVARAMARPERTVRRMKMKLLRHLALRAPAVIENYRRPEFEPVLP